VPRTRRATPRPRFYSRSDSSSTSNGATFAACGTCHASSKAAQERGFDAHGLDIDGGSIAHARRHYPINTFFHGTIESLAAAPEALRFVFVYCSEVIEQLPDVPEAKTVSAAYTSQTCPQCGHQDRENRPKLPDSDGFILDRFSCQSCGYQADADLNAGQVIAIQRMWRESLPKSQRPKLMSELKENYSFNPHCPDDLLI
jgi:hypothetical protein